jgi:hypothetical protein
MPDYLLVHDRAFFSEQLQPALGEAWRRRSFAPCRGLVEAAAAQAEEYARRYLLDPDDFLFPRTRDGLPFDRAVWRTVVGELLVVCAVEIPELPAHLETLHPLLVPASIIRQVTHGSRDLTFGLAAYRPDHAGLNDAEDVARLATYLAAVPAESWELPRAADLDDEEWAEELAFAREWFEVLRDLHVRSASAGRVIVAESIF